MSTSTPESSTKTGPTYLNFIGGQWKNARSGETFVSTNPAHTSQIIGHYQQSRREDLEEAVAAAVEAQRSWTATPAPTRGEILYRAAHLFAQRREELAELMTREMGKTLKETRGEVEVTIDVAKFMAGEAKRAEGETIPSMLPEKLCLTLRHPLGVVGLITPWNFPLAIWTLCLDSSCRYLR